MRHQAVKKGQIRDFLLDGDWHTIGEMADFFEVNPETVRQRLRELIKDQVSLIVGQSGYKMISPKDIRGIEDAQEVEQMLKWVICSVSRLADSGKTMKQLAQTASKFLPKNAGERARLRSSFVKITHLIDWQESDIL